MAKPTGFLEYQRVDNYSIKPQQRILNFDEFHQSLNPSLRKQQGARCMNCGVPFCQSAISIKGTVSGCPLHNLIPEWNDEIYRGNEKQALARLLKTNCFPEFTGRVCPALCEKACVCGLNDDPVTIKDNELYIIETAFKNSLIKANLPSFRTGKKVAVIGSGPAGLTVAYQLNQKGHEVTVYEKGELGGKFKALSTPPEKDTFMMFDRYLVSQMKKYNIEVINKEVKSDDEFAADTIIQATGSTQIIPPIQGIEQEFVLQAEDVLENQKELKGNVVVIGGGLVGTETCKYLGNQGAHVTLVEMKDNIADGIGATFIGHMFAKLAEYQVDVKTSETVKEIKNHEVVLSNTTVPCDYVVIAAGYKSRNELAEELSKKYDVKVVGDAASPRRILDATAEAYRVINGL